MHSLVIRVVLNGDPVGDAESNLQAGLRPKHLDGKMLTC